MIVYFIYVAMFNSIIDMLKLSMRTIKKRLADSNFDVKTSDSEKDLINLNGKILFQKRIDSSTILSQLKFLNL